MAIICNNCGYAYNNDGTARCAICDFLLKSASGDIVTTEDKIVKQGVSQKSPLKTPSHPNSFKFNGSVSNKNNTVSTPSIPTNQKSIEGRISHIERHEERPPADIYAIMSKILIGLLIFIPYLVLAIFTGIMSFAFGFLGFSGLSQLFNPMIWSTSIFEFLELLVLKRIRGTDTVPIYRGIIEDSSNRELTFSLRGPLKSGNLVLGHHVRVSGEWREGNFLVWHGTDQTANSSISPRYRNPWRRVFFIFLFLYAIIGAGGLLFFAQLKI